MSSGFKGLVAATHTPFTVDGELDLSRIEALAGHLEANGVTAAFIGGSTGESHSLTLTERLALAERWAQVTRGSALRLIVHVGSNCLADSAALAAQAGQLGADAIAAVAPSYFKPATLDALVECGTFAASRAPETPFYYYDIPPLTGLQFSMPDYLMKAADRIPSFAGIKFSNPDLLALQHCLNLDGGRFEVLFGIDEYLLAALALGVTGAVGSTYNFASPIHHRMIRAFQRGDIARAREEQFRSARLVSLLAKGGFMASARCVLGLLGVPVGPPRLPHRPLDSNQEAVLRAGLEKLGFFDWLTQSDS